MIKLRSLLKEEMTSLGSMKIQIQLADLFFNLEQCPKGYIYAYPQDQTRFYKSLEKFSEKQVVQPLLNKINNVYGESGFYVQRGPVDVTKPIVFQYIPNDKA